MTTETNDTNTETKIKPDWYALAFDETGLWNIAEKDRPLIKRMLGVYFFNRAERTHLCEITPSYCLYHLENVIEMNPDLPDEEWDIERERLNVKYVDEQRGKDEAVTYMHVSTVEQFMKDHADRVHHYGEPTNAEAAAEDQGEAEVLEYYQGNAPF